jgi:uncharacterized membrane protein
MFLTILIVSIAALIASTAIGFAVFSSTQNSNNWMSQMWGGSSSSGMGGMMGQTGTTQVTANPSLTYFGVLFAVLVSVTIIGVIGITYYLVYPQIRMGALPPMQNSAVIQPATNGGTPYDAVSKTLTEEERKIIEVLNSHEGKYLQKYIRNETGLSRLKTHRIVSLLAERGIVSTEKTGNTNEVILSDWLNESKVPA